MRKRGMSTVFAVLFMVSIGFNIASWSQTRRPAPAKGSNTWVKVPKSETDFLPGQTRWRTARILNMDNKYFFGVSSNHYLQLRPEARTGPSDSQYHTEVTEVFYIVKGKGVAQLGGELEGAYWDEANDHEIRVVRGPSVNGRYKNFDLGKRVTRLSFLPAFHTFWAIKSLSRPRSSDSSSIPAGPLTRCHRPK